MSTRSQQSTETKIIITKYKKMLTDVTDIKIAKAIILEATNLGENSIQQQKISKSLIDFIKKI